MIAAGGAAGAVARYFVSLWFAQRLGMFFPYGTLVVNIAGCFIIGFVMTLINERVVLSEHWRLLSVVGFAGGLTTFSTYSYETLKLLQNGEPFLALANVFLNLLLGFLALLVGVFLARLI